MLQLLQRLDCGKTFLADVPAHVCAPASLLIKTRVSLVSLGTEKMLLEFAKAGWLEKLRLQPDRVKQVLAKMRTDGLVPTFQTVRARLAQPVPLGYCNVGAVLQVGAVLTQCEFSVGDRVVSNGPHAETVCVPPNLCARIPDGVSDDEAAFTVLGAIALHGIRLAQPTFGERFLVVGLGLIGLLTVQLLRAHGCEVLGTDLREDRLRLARRFGAETVNVRDADMVAAAQAWTRHSGVDAVIITAATPSDFVIHQAAQACRKRARIILVGVVGLKLKREDFYRKELTFQVSCSYGPGRYDFNYEQGSLDYPLPYVRWTEKRNFEAVLNAIQRRLLDVQPLITHRFTLDQAINAYDTVRNDPSALGVLLEYSLPADFMHKLPASKVIRLSSKPTSSAPHAPVIAVVGAGNFSRTVLLPTLHRTPARRAYIVDVNPVFASHAARKFGFEQAATDYQAVLEDSQVTTVFIATDHNTHAGLVREALLAGKHVFVEKPLCLTEAELNDIATTYQEVNEKRAVPLHLVVGFNRRFSPHTRCLQKLLVGRREPLCMNLTVNAGEIDGDHWLQDPTRGGGRIIGEACHFIDLLAFLAAGPIVRISAMMAGPSLAVRSDKMSIHLGLADGSIGTLNYFANGTRQCPKEALEIFSEGRILRLDNFRITRGYGFKGFRRFKTWRQDKGHKAEIACFVEQVSQGNGPLIPFEEISNVTRASFAAMTSAMTGQTIRL